MGIMEELIFLHDFINIILIFIITFVGFIIVSMLFNSFINKNLLERQIIECILTIKAIGHQWYRRYEYRDFWAIGNGSQVEFDAYTIPTNELRGDIFRLLDVDTRIVVPFNIHVRVLISSADVLHAWTVPSLGVKADAVPGRLNQVKFIAQRAGLFFGQCSEICGANHSFIPIVLEIVNSKTFLN